MEYISLAVETVFQSCDSYHDFPDRQLLLTRKLLNQGFLVVKLKSSHRKLYGRYPGLVNRCVSVSTILRLYVRTVRAVWRFLFITSMSVSSEGDTPNIVVLRFVLMMYCFWIVFIAFLHLCSHRFLMGSVLILSYICDTAIP
jgi:hypothetical protein